jgi:hypothetical protein
MGFDLLLNVFERLQCDQHTFMTGQAAQEVL